MDTDTTYDWRHPIEMTVGDFVASVQNDTWQTVYPWMLNRKVIGILVQGGVFYRRWWVTGNFFYATNSDTLDSVNLSPFKDEIVIRFVWIDNRHEQLEESRERFY